jgi:chromosome segregation ATPase
MFFGLGFLVAALIALVIIPALNARAERLARRRLEALFPLSISELTAEKDHLRAEFAVLQRRLERKAEEALASKHQDMEELGRRAVRIQALDGELAARDHKIGELEADLERSHARFAEADADLATTRQELAASRETHAAIEAAQRRTLDELSETRGRLEAATAALAEARTAFSETQERLRVREAEFADLDTRHTATLNELDAKRIKVSDLETRLGTQTSRADELEHALGERRIELADERRRVSELAQNLVNEQARIVVLEKRMRSLESEWEAHAAHWAKATNALDGQAEDGAALAATAPLPNGGEAPATKLADAERRIAELEAALRQEKERGEEALRSENAKLRQRIEEVADEIMRVSAAAPEPQRSRSTG